jgi:hypothetical protein
MGKKKAKDLFPPPKDIGESALAKFIAELTRVMDEHRMLVITTSGYLEMLVNTVIEVYCKNAKKINENNRDYSFSVKLVLLHEMGKITDANFANANWLRNIRNRAAHDPIFEVTRDDVAQLARGVGASKDFDYAVCLMIFTEFWNDHRLLFSKTFMPPSPILGHGMPSDDERRAGLKRQEGK